MNLTLHTTELVTLLLCSARILAWMMFAPPMATAGVPKTVQTILSVAIALAVVPTAQAHCPAPEFVPVTGSLLCQVVIGAGLGFATRLLFTAVESAGSLLDMFGGFSMAAAYDPLSRSTSSVYGRFYMLLCTTLIFVTDAHLLIFAGFLRSFTAIPLDAMMNLGALSEVLTHGVSSMFVAALQIAGPLIVVLFIADIALGVLNRIAPQLNAFTMSFPIKVGLTLVLVGLGLTLLPNTVLSLTGQVNDAIGALM